MGHNSLCMTSEGVFLKIECVKIRTVPQTAKKGGYLRSKLLNMKFFLFRISPSKVNFKKEKMLTGNDATAISLKKKLFLSELDHGFGFTPFYGNNLYFHQSSRYIKVWLR
jgi:hypothetical protein